MNNERGSLDVINVRDIYDLKNQLNLLFGNHVIDDENIMLESIQNSHYHYPLSLSNINDIVMLSVNVCSLMSKFNSVSDYINNLFSNNVNVKVIALQEIWNVPYPELVSIKGFNLVTNQRKSGGGVLLSILKTM
jgi:hypothetical protein